MAQRSLPQAGSGVGDSGPYSSDEWAELFQIVFTGDQEATQGVLYRYANELEVTHPAALTVRTATGAGFTYGHWLVNDANVDIAVTLCAAGKTRYDRVVMVENNTNAAYNTNLALPAAYAAGVPRNSARIAILTGTEGTPGLLPGLLTGPAYYMVELARYQVTDSAVGTITDYRDWCQLSTEVVPAMIENRTRHFWVPALTGYNETGGANIELRGGGMAIDLPGPRLDIPQNDYSAGAGRFIVPADYVSNMVATAVSCGGSGGGNVYVNNLAYAAECSEIMSTHSCETGFSAVALELGGGMFNWYDCIKPLTIAGIGTSDIVLLQLYRDGTNILDTYNSTLKLTGWIVTYTADS